VHSPETRNRARDGDAAAGTVKSEKANRGDCAASTCVAIADMRMHFASEPECKPIDKERLTDEALRAYQQAIKSDPGCIAAYVGLARLYQKLEEHDKAVATLDTALQAARKTRTFGLSRACVTRATSPGSRPSPAAQRQRTGSR